MLCIVVLFSAARLAQQLAALRDHLNRIGEIWSRLICTAPFYRDAQVVEIRGSDFGLYRIYPESSIDIQRDWERLCQEKLSDTYQ